MYVYMCIAVWNRWKHRIEFVREWGRVTKGLTTEIVWVMSGHRSKRMARSDSAEMVLSQEASTFTYLNDVGVVRNFHRFLSLKGNPSAQGRAHGGATCQLTGRQGGGSGGSEFEDPGMKDDIFFGMSGAFENNI